jgi:hypothetical protein
LEKRGLLEMAKAMTFDELMDYAMRNYDKGGDGVVECWDKTTFDAYVRECGDMTKTKARQLFRLYKDTTDDVQGY